MPNRTDSAGARPLRSSISALMAGSALLLLTACTAQADDGPPPERVVTQAPVTATATPTPTPALLPPSVIASAEPTTPAPYYPPTAPVLEPETTEYTTQYTQPSPVPPPPPEPVEPVLPPPSAIDSRGLPLGTTCSTVSCTSPDGVTFVNPDAVPLTQPFDLCGPIACLPPGIELGPGLPSTGSAG